MGEPMSTRPPSHARGLRRKPSSALSTGSATAPSKRSWSAWWTRRCSTSVSYARWPIRLRRPRPRVRPKPRSKQRRRVGGDNAGDSGGVGAALPVARRRRVDWLESHAGTESARAHDLLGHGAGGVIVDAAVDALDHGDRHREHVAGAGSGTFLAGRRPVEWSVGGAAAGYARDGAKRARRCQRLT